MSRHRVPRGRRRLAATAATVFQTVLAAGTLAFGSLAFGSVPASAAPATAPAPPHTDTVGSGPAQPNFWAAAGYAAAFPQAAPPGANDWSCKPSAAHPDPVVLSNGTFTDAYDDWAGLSGTLAANGYCVFVANFGGSTPTSTVQTTGPIEDTASGLSGFADRVLAATGAAKVDVVGHSQGGMNPRYWIKNLGGASKIGALIGLAPSNHGTTEEGMLTLANEVPGGAGVVSTGCAACEEQYAGSPFLTALNSGGETVAGIAYTVIETNQDEVVTPYTSAFLAAAPNVSNILLQDVCAQDFVQHVNITYDPNVARLVLNALDPATAVPVACRPVPPTT